MSYAEEILRDAENWMTPKEFKRFWDKQGIVIGQDRINKTLRKISGLKNSTDYIRVFGSIKNRRVHKLKVLDFIMEGK